MSTCSLFVCGWGSPPFLLHRVPCGVSVACSLIHSETTSLVVVMVSSEFNATMHCGTSYTTPYAWTTQESAPSNAAKVTTRTDLVISSTLTFRTDARPTSTSLCVIPSSLLSWQRVPSAQVSQRKLVRLPRTCTIPQLWSRLEECSFRWQWNRSAYGLRTALRLSKGLLPAPPLRVSSRPVRENFLVLFCS